jgi:hypothetical protein
MGIAVGDGIHRPLMRLMNRLDAVGTVLMAAVQHIRLRRAAGDAAEDAPPRQDVDRAWFLLGETIRWTRVLVLRFCADIAAAKAAMTPAEPAESEPAEPEKGAAEAVPEEPVRTTQRGPRAPDPDRAIRRKSIAEILERVCADLGAAATLLGETEAVREVAAIVEAVRALLDGAVEGAAVVVAQVASGFGVSAPGPAMLPGAPGPACAPDSG